MDFIEKFFKLMNDNKITTVEDEKIFGIGEIKYQRYGDDNGIIWNTIITDKRIVLFLDRSPFLRPSWIFGPKTIVLDYNKIKCMVNNYDKDIIFFLNDLYLAIFKPSKEILKYFELGYVKMSDILELYKKEYIELEPYSKIISIPNVSRNKDYYNKIKTMIENNDEIIFKQIDISDIDYDNLIDMSNIDNIINFIYPKTSAGEKWQEKEKEKMKTRSILTTCNLILENYIKKYTTESEISGNLEKLQELLYSKIGYNISNLNMIELLHEHQHILMDNILKKKILTSNDERDIIKNIMDLDSENKCMNYWNIWVAGPHYFKSKHNRINDFNPSDPQCYIKYLENQEFFNININGIEEKIVAIKMESILTKFIKKFTTKSQIDGNLEKLQELIYTKTTRKIEHRDMIKLLHEHQHILMDNILKKKVSTPTNEKDIIKNIIDLDSGNKCMNYWYYIDNHSFDDDSKCYIKYLENRKLFNINNIYEKMRKFKSEEFENDLDYDENLEDIKNMNGYEFEEFISKVFSGKGYIVEMTKKTGDQGADLIVKKDSIKTAVQTKRHDGNVSNSAVQEVVASMKYYHCNKSMVVSTGIFTKSAIELAKRNNCELIGLDKIERFIRV